MYFCLFLEDSPYCQYVFVVCRRSILDTGCCGAGMDDGVISNVDRHMAAVADDIARLGICKADAVS